jgi:hypothetical protein
MRIASLCRALPPTRSSSCGKLANDWVTGCGPVEAGDIAESDQMSVRNR